MTGIFDEVVTNPAEWDESGLLQVRRRIDPSGPQHQCKVGCSPNMCKGDELDAFLGRQVQPYDLMAYVGDGENDFCPILRLRSGDIAFVRKGRGLQKRIEREGPQRGLRCQVKYWAGAWEVEEYFTQLAA